jgi:hypothetical protein
MLARKIIESLNVSPIYFIVAFNLSQNLSLIAGICIYDCKPIQVIILQKESRVNAEIKTIFIFFISIFIFLNIFWVLFVLFTTNQNIIPNR